MEENTRLYTYDKTKELDFTITRVEENNSSESAFPARLTVTSFLLTYSSPYKTGIEINDRVYCELFFPGIYKPDPGSKSTTKLSRHLDYPDTMVLHPNDKENSIPILILIHGFMSDFNRLYNYYYFIGKMLEKGIACAFINLPFHLNRRPRYEKSGRRLIYYDDIETLEFFHQSVVDVKRLIDIILGAFPVESINICGISLGSMVSLITASQDKRINKTILLMGGGNWKEIHWNGLLRFILKGNCIPEDHITEEKCKEFYSKFHDFSKKFKEVSPEKLTPGMNHYPSLKELLPRKCFLCDPLLFAHKVDPKKVLMINSRLDFYFSKRSTMELWEELGKPRIYWLNYFHTTKILTKPHIIQKIASEILDLQNVRKREAKNTFRVEGVLTKDKGSIKNQER
ncbi:MAG: alpha/beta hydrolase family protein [Actinobacteria bacterium]|nr:alpha/beta hydrolase family protein [Actinomycetota bacterium]